MKDLGCWLRKAKKYRVFEPEYQLFPQELVQETFDRIKSSFLLIADVTQPSHGVGFEIGFAHCMGKKIILVAEEKSYGCVSKFLSASFPNVIYFANSDDLIKGVVSRLADMNKRGINKEQEDRRQSLRYTPCSSHAG